MSFIAEYLKKNTLTEVKSRGGAILRAKSFYIVDESSTQLKALVNASNGKDTYTVTLSFAGNSDIKTTCTCPYTGTGICKHKVAMLLFFDKSESSATSVKLEKPVVYNQKNTHIPYQPLTAEYILANSSPANCRVAHDFYTNYQYIDHIKVTKKEKNHFDCEVNMWSGKALVKLAFHNNYFDASCNCKDTKAALCSHKILVIKILTNNFQRPNALLELPAQKFKKEFLAKSYGLENDIKTFDQYFDTSLDYKTGDLVAVPKISGLQPIQMNGNMNQLFQRNINQSTPILQKTFNTKDFTHAFFFGESHQFSHNLNIDILIGKINTAKKTFDCYSSENGFESRNSSPSVAMTDPQTSIAQTLRHLSEVDFDDLFEVQDRAQYENLCLAYIFEELNKIKSLLQHEIIYENNDREFFQKTGAKRVFLSPNDYQLVFSVSYEKPFYSLSPMLNFDGKSEVEYRNHYIISGKTMYFYKSTTDFHILNQFAETPKILVHENAKNEFIENYVSPISKSYPIIMHTKSLNITQSEATGYKPVIYLGESGNFMLIQPEARYDQKDVELLLQEKILLPEGDKHIDYLRDEQAEKATIDFLTALHPDFPKQMHRGYFYVKFEEILNKGWYFTFFEALKANDIEVFGLEKIKTKKIYPYKPTVNTKIASGIDWFEINMEVSFGDQLIHLKDIQKAILRKEDYVQLDDGSFGMLPEEWLEKYTDLFKSADIDKKGEFKISKLHFSLVDEMFDLIDQQEIYKEIFEKKQRLISFETIEKPVLPKGIQATLRPYQEAGYHWLSFLDSYKWGGCLADDMGLGKTIQMITFLKSIIDATPKETNLVIVPTSLLFNWERELNKFAPDIKYLINSGVTRIKDIKELKKYQLIISTYGLIINDVEELQKLKFNYVVLDESQAIKNPVSQRYKAVCLLKSNNRMVMTGTPVENNTFDLYAQMSFINPGLLGNLNHFKTTFSDPIDKNGDPEAAASLRRLIKPFMLRRTKEQVATDLPDKTEDIIICEMGAEQRKVYDAYKNNYKEMIAKSIDSDGLGKSSMVVLDALLKLRQICNSPSLIKGENLSKESVKIQELVRHITQKTGNHKILIFSQFVEMLGLIKKEIQKTGVKFEYLDGSIASHKREAIVQNFQQNDEIRIFLISLKAGGVGLNLTEADYVYLVDPWWNPAVEAQAIDRTHRIGQTKKVFAYKMICKDTIEEKVLLLQEKKKKVASDIISTEQSFYKQLEKEDIMELFG